MTGALPVCGNDGTVSADSRRVTPGVLDSLLGDLSRRKGTVWYYREAGDQAPSEAVGRTVTEVLGAIIRHRLPVRMSSRPDFTDVVDAAGQSHPVP